MYNRSRREEYISHAVEMNLDVYGSRCFCHIRLLRTMHGIIMLASVSRNLAENGTRLVLKVLNFHYHCLWLCWFLIVVSAGLEGYYSTVYPIRCLIKVGLFSPSWPCFRDERKCEFKRSRMLFPMTESLITRRSLQPNLLFARASKLLPCCLFYLDYRHLVSCLFAVPIFNREHSSREKTEVVMSPKRAVFKHPRIPVPST